MGASSWIGRNPAGYKSTFSYWKASTSAPLPSESLVMGKPFRADSWWEEVELIAEVGGLRLSFFTCALDFTLSLTSISPLLFP